jgi:DTW domain-containing protein YfiP
MSREMCYRCFWPKPLCWCGSIQPMATRTHFLVLMHPKEFKEEKAGTGRLTHLCLKDSEIQVGMEFDRHEAVQEILRDPRYAPFLLYPGTNAIDLTAGSDPAVRTDLHTRLELAPVVRGEKRLLVVILDATWSAARKMLRLSPSLQRLPRVMFRPTAPSRFVIKQQPQPGCLSTLEAVHELLHALTRAGLDAYPLPDQLPGLFERMQAHQIRCASNPDLPGYRKKPYGDPAKRRVSSGESRRRRNYLKLTAAPIGAAEVKVKEERE